MPIAYALKNMIGVSERYRATSSPIFVELFRKAKNSRLLSMVFRCQKKIFILYCQLEMAWDVKRPVFGPSAKVLKQSAINSLAVTSFQAAEVCSQIRRKFIFHNLTTKFFCCFSLHFTVLLTFRLTCFHANEWSMLWINQSTELPICIF